MMNSALEPAGLGTINLPREGGACLAGWAPAQGLPLNVPLIGLEIYANPGVQAP